MCRCSAKTHEAGSNRKLLLVRAPTPKVRAMKITLLFLIFVGSFCHASGCDDFLQLYPDGTPLKQYPSGFIVPDADSEEEKALLQANAGEILYFEERKGALDIMDAKQLVFFLHKVSVTERVMFTYAVQNNTVAELSMAADMAREPVDHIVARLIRFPLGDLLPYVEELRVVVANLSLSFSGQDASIEIQIKLIELSDHIPELGKKRIALVRNLLPRLAMRLTSSRIPNMRKYVDEILSESESGKTSDRLTIAAGLITQHLNSPSPNPDYLSYLVQKMPDSYDLAQDPLPPDVLTDIHHALSKLRLWTQIRPTALDVRHMAKIEALSRDVWR
jgi:hypothetical protein